MPRHRWCHLRLGNNRIWISGNGFFFLECLLIRTRNDSAQYKKSSRIEGPNPNNDQNSISLVSIPVAVEGIAHIKTHPKFCQLKKCCKDTGRYERHLRLHPLLGNIAEDDIK